MGYDAALSGSTFWFGGGSGFPLPCVIQGGLVTGLWKAEGSDLSIVRAEDSAAIVSVLAEAASAGADSSVDVTGRDVVLDGSTGEAVALMLL